MLVERPKMRIVWATFCLALALGVPGVTVLVTVSSPGEHPVRDVSIAGAVALVAAALAALSLRMGVVADQDGVQVTNMFRRHLIAWSDLTAIELEEIPAEISIGFHRLVFVTRQQTRIIADAPTGLAEPGHKMFELLQGLGAVWQNELDAACDADSAGPVRRLETTFRYDDGWVDVAPVVALPVRGEPDRSPVGEGLEPPDRDAGGPFAGELHPLPRDGIELADPG